MTDHGCRCETCTTKQCPTETLATDEEIGLVSISHGLLCHSNAREWRMKDVIEELDRVIKEDNVDMGEKAGLSYAITLIKNGVKKE